MIGMKMFQVGETLGRTRILWLPLKPVEEFTPVEKAIAREMRKMGKRDLWLRRQRYKRLGIDHIQYWVAVDAPHSYGKRLLRTMVQAGILGRIDHKAGIKLRGIPEYQEVRALAAEILPKSWARTLAAMIKGVQA